MERSALDQERRNLEHEKKLLHKQQEKEREDHFFNDGFNMPMPSFSFPSFGSMFGEPHGFMENEFDPFGSFMRKDPFEDNISKQMKKMSDKLKEDMADMSENMKEAEADAEDGDGSTKSTSFSSSSTTKTGKDGEPIKHVMVRKTKCKNGECKKEEDRKDCEHGDCKKVKCINGDCFMQMTHHFHNGPANTTKAAVVAPNTTTQAQAPKNGQPVPVRVRIMGNVPSGQQENG